MPNQLKRFLKLLRLTLLTKAIHKINPNNVFCRLLYFDNSGCIGGMNKSTDIGKDACTF